MALGNSMGNSGTGRFPRSSVGIPGSEASEMTGCSSVGNSGSKVSDMTRGTSSGIPATELFVLPGVSDPDEIEPRHEKTRRSSGFPTRSDTNRAIQPQQVARGLNFVFRK